MQEVLATRVVVGGWEEGFGWDAQESRSCGLRVCVLGRPGTWHGSCRMLVAPLSLGAFCSSNRTLPHSSVYILRTAPAPFPSADAADAMPPVCAAPAASTSDYGVSTDASNSGCGR